jgi:prepilin-type N-terminal cleavage/methylation domain-containing protein
MRRTAQGFTLIEIMVVITIIAALVSTVAIVVPKMQEQSKQNTCLNNLQQLGHVYLMKDQADRAKAQKYSGVALWLSYRKKADDIRRGEEKVLMCPGDPACVLPDTDEERKKWDSVDLDNPADNLCSFAARDFRAYPTNVESQEKEIIGCDRQGSNGKTMHHRGVILCYFDSGDVQKMTREQLGLSAEAETIVIGPEAESPMMKKVAYIVRKKD